MFQVHSLQRADDKGPELGDLPGAGEAATRGAEAHE